MVEYAGALESTGNGSDSGRLSGAPSQRWHAAFVALIVLIGSAALLAALVYASGGTERLFAYSKEAPHKLTADAMLHGTLRLRKTLLGSEHDEQVYNGATFTNWGFGVPLLQLPFHAAVRALRRGSFFPDRLIFFLYASVSIVALWTALHRALARHERGYGPWVASWCIALTIVGNCLFPLVAYRFIQYEQAIAYLVVFELLALALYLLHLDSPRLHWVCATGVAAGIALVVRPTGAAYLVLWGILLLLRSRTKKTAVAYVLSIAPFVAFWCYSNWVKGGSPLSLGYRNATPWFPYHLPMTRFGSRCSETLHASIGDAIAVLKGFFFRVDVPPPELAACHFEYETRMPGEHMPFFSPAILLLICGGPVLYLTQRAWRLELYLPHLVFAMILALLVKAGFGFAFRYIGDFWPLLALMALQFARYLALLRHRLARNAVVATCAIYSAAPIVQDVWPYLPSVETLDAAHVEAMEADWLRMQAQEQPAFPTRIACGDRLPTWPVSNGLGWGAHCEVADFTNLYLGVPSRMESSYTLRFQAEHPRAPSLQVFVNGNVYTARLEGDTYVAPVSIHYRRLYSPVVVVTIQWSREDSLPGEKLVMMELV